MGVSKIWALNRKKVILSYISISFTLSIFEILLTGAFFLSFFISYFGIFFIAPYIRTALNEFFKQFHVKRVVRLLLTPWILFIIILFYVNLFFLSIYLVEGKYLGFTPLSTFILFLCIIFLILESISPLIRIIAVAIHRRKINLFPINRIEFVAMEYLKKSDHKSLAFSELKEQIRGTFNIFIPKIYFDEDTAISSIYHLCGLRFADIHSNNIVSLNQEGETQEFIWNDTLKRQKEKFDKILNSNNILIKSFSGLFILSILKIFIGWFNSESLMAEGFENFLDCIAVILIGLGIKYKKEKFVNVILVILMTFTAGTILYGSIESLILGPKAISNIIIIVIIALISIFLNTYMRAIKNFVGKKSRNSSLVASAIDSKVNIMISVGIIIGALFSGFGRSLGFSFFFYLDPIIAIVICIFILKEVIEIFQEFIKGKEEEIEFESFQMTYEENFKEYIIKWIFSFLNDHYGENFTPEQLNELFKTSLHKGDVIYTEFSHFGLYLFNEKGIGSIIDNLLKQNWLAQVNGNFLQITQKGQYLYDNLYSHTLLDDIKDPFDFFFEQNYGFEGIRYKKRDLMETKSFSNLI